MVVKSTISQGTQAIVMLQDSVPCRYQSLGLSDAFINKNINSSSSRSLLGLPYCAFSLVEVCNQTILLGLRGFKLVASFDAHHPAGRKIVEQAQV